MEYRLKYRNKNRNKQLTRIQRSMRKLPSATQSICSLAGIKLKKNEPRWRLLRKVRNKYGM